MVTAGIVVSTIRLERLSSIIEALTVLLEPSSVAELRSPNKKRQTLSGYFNDHGQLAEAAAGLSGTAPGAYVTLNPVCVDFISLEVRTEKARPIRRAMNL
jgi:hypothetical protein